jgi:hypothetical protein
VTVEGAECGLEMLTQQTDNKIGQLSMAFEMR